MTDYALTTEGLAFFERVLAMCDKFRLSWAELWTSTQEMAVSARRFLGIEEVTDDVCRLLGAATVCSVVLAAIAGGSLHNAKILLGKADLLSEQNVSVAAESFGVSSEEMWDLLASE